MDFLNIEGSQDPIEVRLSVHRRNLDRLEVQKASFGIQVPLSILNEIDYQKQQIALLEEQTSKKISLRAVQLLPRRVVEFLDRDVEQARAKETLLSSGVVLIHGPAGIGKSALANRVAWDIGNQFQDGVLWFFVRGKSLLEIMWTICQTVSEDQLRIIKSQNTVLDAYKLLMAHRRMLICFDNVETAEQIGDMIVWAPNTAFLITSRRALDIDTHCEIDLQPFGINEAGYMLDRSAGKVREGQTGEAIQDEQIRSICEKLGGLPLALELAGRLIRHKRFQNLNELSRALDERKAIEVLSQGDKSVWTSIALGYQELDQKLQQVFLSLSLLCDESFDEKAVSAMWGFDCSDVLYELVQTSLLQRLQIRFQLHPLIREFAASLIKDLENVDRLRANLSMYFLNFAKDNALNFAALHTEKCDLERAVEWAFSQELVDIIYETLISLYLYLDVTGEWELIDEWFRKAIGILSDHDKGKIGYLRHYLAGNLVRRSGFDEAARLLKLNLAEIAEADSPELVALGWYELANIAFAIGDYRDARSHYLRSLGFMEHYANKRGIADAKRKLGAIEAALGNYNESDRLLSESQAIYEDLGDQLALADILKIRGSVAHEQRFLDTAWDYYSKSLDVVRKLGDRWGQHSVCHELGRVAIASGNRAQAKELFQESIAIADQLGDPRGKAATLHELGRLAFSERDLSTALKYFIQSTELRLQLNDKSGLADNLYQEARVRMAAGDVQTAREYLKQSLDKRKDIGDKRGMVAALYWLGRAEVLLGNEDSALNYFAQGLSISEEINHHFWMGKMYVGIAKVCIGEKKTHALETSQKLLTPFGISVEEDDLFQSDI